MEQTETYQILETVPIDLKAIIVQLKVSCHESRQADIIEKALRFVSRRNQQKAFIEFCKN